MIQLAEEIVRLCGDYGKCRMEVERREEGKRIRQEIGLLCRKAEGRMSIEVPELLVAVLDAYEVTRDEGMLQEVLDVVSGNLERLGVSVESVKLLAYCWYYVEEEECAVKAREMLVKLKKEGKDVTEAEKMMEELCSDRSHHHSEAPDDGGEG